MTTTTLTIKEQFDAAPIVSAPGTVQQSDATRAGAEVQAAMVAAKRFPRDQRAAIDRIMNACTRRGLAEQSIYSYRRGGSVIEGPSIRLAEVLAQQWGNLHYGLRQVESGSKSEMVAYCWDLETNVRREIAFDVPHERHTRNGVTLLEDPRDVYEHVANYGARRLRACILGIIPGDVVEEAVQACGETMNAHADTSPEAVAKLVTAFDALGVSKAQIEKRIQSRLDAIRPGQVVQLRKTYQSLRDGASEPADWFEVVEAEAPSPGADAAKKAAGKAAKAATLPGIDEEN